jgi:anaerobic selenocysteine-containing dehydrogenase
LTLISPATAHTISSTFGQLVKGQVPVELNPQDAERRGIAEGEQVRVFNDYGEVHCLLARNPDLPAGVALLPKGLWSHNTLNGNTANPLAPDSLADLAGGACFNDAVVEVELLGSR